MTYLRQWASFSNSRETNGETKNQNFMKHQKLFELSNLILFFIFSVAALNVCKQFQTVRNKLAI